MYGIGNNYSMFSSMYRNYGNSGTFVTKYPNQSAWHSWNSMVPNYAQINFGLLNKYMSHNNSFKEESLKELQQHEQSAKSFYSEFNSIFSDLKKSASSLKSLSENSVFRPTGYGSKDSSVAVVSANTASFKAPIKLDVQQTAEAQSYQSAAINSADKTLSGKNTLTLTGADGKKNTMDFNFSASSDNKSNLSQVASTINGKNLGITASVSEKDGKSTLVFTSNKTGTDSAFSASFTGNSASSIGISEQQQARNAMYSEDDGSVQTSQSNEILLANGTLGVTLKGAGTAQLDKRTVEDSNSIDAVKSFADSYNKALSFLSKNSGKSSAIKNLAYSFSTTRFQSSTLSQIGISVDGSGALSVDADKLTKALQNNPKDVEKLLGGANGLATNTYGKAVNAMANSNNLYPKASSTSYPNYMYGRNKNYISAYQSSLFLDSYI